MENRNVPIEIWNIKKHWYRTNNAVEGWNSKLNSIIEKKQSDVFLQVLKLKEKAELLSCQWKSKGTWTAWSVTKKYLCEKSYISVNKI
jgi:hypothetical protein